MVMSLAGRGTKNDRADEDQKQFSDRSDFQALRYKRIRHIEKWLSFTTPLLLRSVNDRTEVWVCHSHPASCFYNFICSRDLWC
jgi:hypothetical protein